MIISGIVFDKVKFSIKIVKLLVLSLISLLLPYQAEAAGYTSSTISSNQKIVLSFKFGAATSGNVLTTNLTSTTQCINNTSNPYNCLSNIKTNLYSWNGVTGSTPTFLATSNSSTQAETVSVFGIFTPTNSLYTGASGITPSVIPLALTSNFNNILNATAYGVLEVIPTFHDTTGQVYFSGYQPCADQADTTATSTSYEDLTELSPCAAISSSTVVTGCTNQVSCPSGSIFDVITEQCDENPTSISSPVCASGLTYNSSITKCSVAPSCSSGLTYNSSITKCSVAPSCPTSYGYNSTYKYCTSTTNVNCPSGFSWLYNTCQGTPTCPNGYTFDEGWSGDCYVPYVSSCPTGTTQGTIMNTSDVLVTGCIKGAASCTSGTLQNVGVGGWIIYQCVAAPSGCATSGATYNSGNNWCQITPTCSAGTFDSAKNVCDAAPTCSAGTFDAANNVCDATVTSGQFNCSAGFTLNANNLCATNATCN